MTVTIRNRNTGRTSMRYSVNEIEVGTEYITFKFDKSVYSTITSARIDATAWEVISVKK